MGGSGGAGPAAEPEHGSPWAAWLSRSTPPQRWDLPLNRRELTIGRLPESDIWLDDSGISRKQATLRLTGTVWTIADDAPSRNGTYVNGTRIAAPRAVHDGDRIVMGETTLTFHRTAAQFQVADVQGPRDRGARNPRRTLAKALVLAGVVQVIGLVGNALGTFFSSLGTAWLRWLLPNVLSVAIAMAGALVTKLVESSEPTEQPVAGPTPVARSRGGPSLAGLLAVVLALGAGGLAVTAGVRYAAGYFSGVEDGVDRLVGSPPTGGNRNVRLAVNHVFETDHFTRVDVTVVNRGQQTQSLPLFGWCSLVGSDGVALEADSFKSQWTEQVAPGVLQRGTITFPGHLAPDVSSATLNFTFGFSPLKVAGIKLRGP